MAGRSSLTFPVSFNIKTYSFAVTGNLTTGNDQAPTLETVENETIVGVRLIVKTAPTGSAIIVDVNRTRNGATVSLFLTANRPQIAINGTRGESTTVENSGLQDEDQITVDIDQIGSGTAGADLTIEILTNPA